jgi:tRNA modification GTPase
LEPRDLIEKKAIQRTKKHIDSADLTIVVFDGSQRLTRQDMLLLRKLKKKNAIAVVNKSDLRQRLNQGELTGDFSRVIALSAKKAKNLNLLEDAIVDLVNRGKLVSPEPCLVTNLRHIQSLKEAEKFVAQAVNSLDNNLSLEFIAGDIQAGLSEIDVLLGKKFSEDLLDRIFAEFCIGK